MRRSRCAPKLLRKEWGWAKCALYAARKEFELLKLLSTADEKVVALARTMGQAEATTELVSTLKPALELAGIRNACSVSRPMSNATPPPRTLVR